MVTLRGTSGEGRYQPDIIAWRGFASIGHILSVVTPPVPEHDALIGQVVLGRYEVEARVAQGGFAVVYRARHQELGVPVAIKVLTAADRFAGAARRLYLAQFRQEAVTLASLNHPALVRVLDVGTVGGDEAERPCMAMEWLEGVSLEDELATRAGAGRGPREALALLRPAFDGLACAHDAGVSHRDLKPSNLMRVTARRGEPGLRVIDFGVAKVDPEADGPGGGSTSTASPITGYTAAYAAPEQITRSRTGPWTDVHALALLLVEVLRGAPGLHTPRGRRAAGGDPLRRAPDPRPLRPARGAVGGGPAARVAPHPRRASAQRRRAVGGAQRHRRRGPARVGARRDAPAVTVTQPALAPGRARRGGCWARSRASRSSPSPCPWHGRAACARPPSRPRGGTPDPSPKHRGARGFERLAPRRPRRFRRPRHATSWRSRRAPHEGAARVCDGPCPARGADAGAARGGGAEEPRVVVE